MNWLIPCNYLDFFPLSFICHPSMRCRCSAWRRLYFLFLQVCGVRVPPPPWVCMPDAHTSSEMTPPLSSTSDASDDENVLESLTEMEMEIIDRFHHLPPATTTLHLSPTTRQWNFDPLSLHPIPAVPFYWTMRGASCRVGAWQYCCAINLRKS